MEPMMEAVVIGPEVRKERREHYVLEIEPMGPADHQVLWERQGSDPGSSLEGWLA